MAYPDAAEPMIAVLAKDQFINSLPEEDIQLRVQQSWPGNLRQALEAALELESYMAASRRCRPVREVLLEGPESGPEECSEAEMCQLEHCVKDLQFHSRAQWQKKSSCAGSKGCCHS